MHRRFGSVRTLWAALCLLAVAVPGADAGQLTQAAGPSGAAPRGAKPSLATPPPSALAQARSWGYQLRGMEPAAIARSPYDVVVIDFADNDRPFTAAEVEVMRTRPDGTKRHVLAYLSIGEAERYRDYWEPAWHETPPAWLGPENPEWRGNFPVRYWDPGWLKLVYGAAGAYLDRIMAAGFDGVYLDRVDVYAYWEPQHPQARRQMLDLVVALSVYARQNRPGFLITVQNAEELLEDDLYLRAIDAVAKEDLLHGLDHTDAANPAADVAYSAGLLKRARRAGKAVLVVEYLCRREAIAKAERRLTHDLGFVAYFGPRTLHRLGMGDDDFCLQPGAGGRRVAMVIGNAAYQHVPPIGTVAADVRAMAAVLRRAGFTEVRERLDLGRDTLLQELQRFTEAARGAEWAVTYYAGLGIHYDGNNYLLPVNARIGRPEEIAREAVLVDTLVQAVEPARQVRLLLIDACRGNVFLEQMQRRGMSKPAGPGITARALSGPVVASYGARCDTALEPQVGDLDAYTAALVQHIPTPDLELPWLLERVRDSVLRTSKGGQDPAYMGTMPDRAVFWQPAVDATTPISTAPEPRPAATPSTAPRRRRP